MAVIRCKMCGADLKLIPDSTIAECEYCGSVQTVPSADNEKKLTLFVRANKLRYACEFDKAAGVYEAIVADFPEEAEAYWGLVLCKYGIEYVDDPATAKKIPTCHRSSFDSIMEDEDFEQVLENADAVARKVYRAEARQIEEIRKGIIEVSAKEEPYDIFICYKETDENGNRTLDSVLAQDIYDALTEKGYRTFFSRITLEDKLGQEYEPYIFAALNSAKVMLAVGTDYEYYNAVWVKNEWSRFLHLIASGQKKALIPCYKNIDAYDMPREFAKLQAQDLGKVGAIQDLLRGIDKVLNKPVTTGTNIQNAAQEAVRTMEQEKTRKQVENAVSLGIMALDAGDNEKAIMNFEAALKYDTECIGAYLGLIRISQNNSSYIKKVNSMPINRVLEYIKTHREIIGDLTKENNLLTISVWAIKSEELVQGLLDMRVDANAQNAFISYVGWFNNPATVQKFITNGANIESSYWWRFNYKVWKFNTLDDDESYELEHHTVLSTAIKFGKCSQIIDLLIGGGANVNHIVKVYKYYQKLGDRPKGNLESTYSILNYAVRSKRYGIVESLLKNGANPEYARIVRKSFIPECTNSDYALFVASFEKEVPYSNISDAILIAKDVKTLELLLSYKANPNLVYEYPVWRDKYYKSMMIGISKRTSFIDAVLNSDDIKMINTLLKYGADAKAKYVYSDSRDFNSCGNKASIPALGLAVQTQNKKCVQCLINHGASFSEQVIYDPQGQNTDCFLLSELAFDNDTVIKMGDTIRPLGWKGSKSGLFSKAHVCYYSW